MIKHPKLIRVTVPIAEELEDIKREKGIISNVEAQRHLLFYNRKGRELERIENLNWSKKNLKEKPVFDISAEHFKKERRLRI